MTAAVLNAVSETGFFSFFASFFRDIEASMETSGRALYEAHRGYPIGL